MSASKTRPSEGGVGESRETICAVATAPGGAIGIVRVSGRDAVAVADRVFRGRISLSEAKTHTAHFGIISSPIPVLPLEDGDGGGLIDEVLATVFRAPHSYTGEDCVEFSCHGSSYILQQVCRMLVDGGCRMAEPGEFTQRAFLNGRMDLAQAEAVADIIASRTRAQHSMAMSQLRGRFSQHIDGLHDRLLHLTTLMELELDFSDHEDLEFADRTELHALCDEILDTVTRLADSFATGNAIKEGVRVAIVGPTNAGKSTLLNAILHEDRAIVSDIHGTTRDTIEDTFVWQGITFRFIDTAGLRATDDTVERIGIDRTLAAIHSAHIVLFMLDIATADSDLGTLQDVVASCPHPHLIIYNKVDVVDDKVGAADNKRDAADNMGGAVDKESVSIESNPWPAAQTLRISAKTGQGLDALQQWVCDTARDMLHIDSADLVVSNQRHHAALVAARGSLARIRTALRDGLPTDLVTQDLRDALHHLATITHREITPDAVLHNIFRHFCVGK